MASGDARARDARLAVQVLKHAVLWGLLLGVAASVSTQILTWLGLGLTYWVWVANYVLVLVLVALGARALRKQQGAPLSLLRAAGLVLVMVLVSKAIWQTYMFVYITYIDPSWVDTVVEVWSQQLREAGAAEDEIATTIEMFRNQWKTRHVFTLGILEFTLPPFVIGFVAAVVAAVRRRNG